MLTKAETRTLLIVDSSGPLRLDIPAGCRLTYGPIMPRMAGDYGLRIYQGKTMIAVVPNVQYFYEHKTVVPFRQQQVEGKPVWKEDDGWWQKAQDAHERLAGKGDR